MKLIKNIIKSYIKNLNYYGKIFLIMILLIFILIFYCLKFRFNKRFKFYKMKWVYNIKIDHKKIINK